MYYPKYIFHKEMHFTFFSIFIHKFCWVFFISENKFCYETPFLGMNVSELCVEADSDVTASSAQTCMMGLVHEQVWMGSQDSVIYILDTNTMTCNKQLTEHRSELTGLSVDTRHPHNRLGACF